MPEGRSVIRISVWTLSPVTNTNNEKSSQKLWNLGRRGFRHPRRPLVIILTSIWIEIIFQKAVSKSKSKSKRMLLSNKPDKITWFSNKVSLDFLSSGLLYCSWCMWHSRKMLKWSERLQRASHFLLQLSAGFRIPKCCNTGFLLYCSRVAQNTKISKDWITYKCLHLQNKWFAHTASTSPPMKSFFTEDFNLFLSKLMTTFVNPRLARRVSFFEKSFD